MTERTPWYRTYWTNVYEPATKRKSGGPLEEALANADNATGGRTNLPMLDSWRVTL